MGECVKCGQKAAARIPGGAPSNPLVMGEDNGRAAMSVVLLQDYDDGTRIHKAGRNRRKWVTGSGLEEAVADGLMSIDEVAQPVTKVMRTPAPKRNPLPYWVQEPNTGSFSGWPTLKQAESRAKRVGQSVLTYTEVRVAQGLAG